jgi:hypothetical protein
MLWVPLPRGVDTATASFETVAVGSLNIESVVAAFRRSSDPYERAVASALETGLLADIERAGKKLSLRKKPARSSTGYAAPAPPAAEQPISDRRTRGARKSYAEVSDSDVFADDE